MGVARNHRLHRYECRGIFLISAHCRGAVLGARRAPFDSGCIKGGTFALAVFAILLIWFGVYPTPLLNLVRTTMSGLN